MFLPITEEENELIKVKIFLILWLEVREARCLFQCVNSKQRFQSHFTQDFRSIKVSQYTATRYILITTEATEQHGNFNSFHFQRWNVTCQHDRQGERLTGQLPSQSRHCALTSHYFKLCPLHKSVLSQILLLFHFFTAVHVSSQRTYENLFLVHRFVVLVLEALYPRHFVFFTSCLH